MRIYNRLLISLAVSLGLVNILLAVLGQDNLAIYFNANAIVYLVVSLFHSNLNVRAQTSVNKVSALIVFGFFITLLFKIVDISQ